METEKGRRSRVRVGRVNSLKGLDRGMDNETYVDETISFLWERRWMKIASGKYCFTEFSLSISLYIWCRIVLNRFMFEDYTGIRDKSILMIKGE